MFRRNSAFTPTEKEVEHVEGIRKRALDADPFPASNSQRKPLHADALLETAESLLDDKEDREVLRLIAQARDELDAGPDLGR